MTYTRTCRFCDHTKFGDRLLKYGERHYAHFKYLVDRGLQDHPKLLEWQAGGAA